MTETNNNNLKNIEEKELETPIVNNTIEEEQKLEELEITSNIEEQTNEGTEVTQVAQEVANNKTNEETKIENIDVVNIEQNDTITSQNNSEEFKEKIIYTETEQPILQTRQNVYSKKIESTLEDYIHISQNFYAGFFVRAIAYTIDCIIVLALSALLNTLTFGYLDFGNFSLMGSSWLFVITHFIYFFLMTYYLSQTLGKMIFGIRVEKNNGDKLSLLDVFFREVVGRFLNTALKLFLYLIVPFTSKKKGVHDYLADSVVVKEDFSSLRRKLNEALK